MNINYHLKNPTAGQSAVNAVIWFKNQRYKLSTGVSVDVRFWDSEKKFIKPAREYKDGDFIRMKLTRFDGAVKAAFSVYMITGETPAIERVRDEINQTLNPQKHPEALKNTRKPSTPARVDFLSFFETYSTNAPYKQSTHKKYTTALNWLLRYEKEYKTRLKFESINLDFYDHFRHFVLNSTYTPRTGEKPRSYSKNYLGSLVKCVKKVLRESGPESRAKLHTNSDYRIRDFKTESEGGDAIYLNLLELDKILKFEPTLANVTPIIKDPRPHNIERKIEALKLTKCKFLIGCFTALRVSDFNRLREINIKENVIVIQPLKGTRKNENVVIPIHPVIREILNTGFDPATSISDQKLNKHLKELAQLAGIDETVSISRTEGGVLVEREFKKWELVTTHTARRSGASNMVKAGIPIYSVMKITGHSTERSLMKYIKISQEENARLLANHPFFK